jgi:ADP-heptose:LPS heptosyltransferase
MLFAESFRAWVIEWPLRLRRYRLLLRLIFLQVRLFKPLLIVIRAAGMGDIIGTLPACRRLLAVHPGCDLVYVTKPHFAPVFGLAGFPVRLLTDEQCILPAVAFHFFRIYRFVNSDDLRIKPEANFIDEFAQSCDLPCDIEEIPQLFPSSQLLEKIKREVNALAGNRFIVTVHTGPSDKVREWPRDKWIELVRMLRELNIMVVQIGLNYHTRWGAVDSGPLEGTVNQLGKLSLEETVGWIAASNCFVGIDSGPLHLAAAVRTPAVALMGPTEARFRFRKISQVSQISAKNVACLGCHHRVPRLHWDTGCPFHIACMSELEPIDVFQEIRQVLPAAGVGTS